MARLNWDRVRRDKPLEGADARVDPDGAVLWEREVGAERAEREGEARAVREGLDAKFAVRRLRPGIVVRRVRARREDGGLGAREAPATPARPPAVSPFDTTAWVECPRCNARVPRRTILLHARAACARRD